MYEFNGGNQKQEAESLLRSSSANSNRLRRQTVALSSNASRRKSDSGHIDSKPGTSRSGLPSRWTRVEPHSKTCAFLRHDQEGEVPRVDRVVGTAGSGNWLRGK